MRSLVIGSMNGSHISCGCCVCAELAIGNITRRVLHMIREESEQVGAVVVAALLPCSQ